VNGAHTFHHGQVPQMRRRIIGNFSQVRHMSTLLCPVRNGPTVNTVVSILWTSPCKTTVPRSKASRLLCNGGRSSNASGGGLSDNYSSLPFLHVLYAILAYQAQLRWLRGNKFTHVHDV
jgi:hypothetical protein